MIEKLLGNGIAGRSGSYQKDGLAERVDLARGIIQRHDDAYSELKLKAHSAAGKTSDCFAYSKGDSQERLERLVIPMDLSGMAKLEHRL